MAKASLSKEIKFKIQPAAFDPRCEPGNILYYAILLPGVLIFAINYKQNRLWTMSVGK